MDEKPDSSFRKYFNWPTLKDPKGTIKTETVVEKRPASKSRGDAKPIKRKKKRAMKNQLTDRVTDEDFLLLESFLLELSALETDQVIFSKKITQISLIINNYSSSSLLI